MSAHASQLRGGRSGSPWQNAWRRLCSNRLAVVCLWLLSAVVLLCLFGPFLLVDPNAQNLSLGASKPSADHWFGTDTLGRDLLARCLVGGRLSLLVGMVATLVALIIGVTYGMISGYRGGRTDAILMRIVDVLYGFPFLIFVILLTTIFERSLVLLFAAIGCIEWLTMARIVRGQVLVLREMEFVKAAQALGQTEAQIFLRHLLPNVLGPVVIYTTLLVPAVMLLEAVLSFLGLGVQPPDASWGVLINDGAQSMETYPWLLLFPALLFSLTLFCLNLIGDGLRDAFDPRAEK